MVEELRDADQQLQKALADLTALDMPLAWGNGDMLCVPSPDKHETVRELHRNVS